MARASFSGRSSFLGYQYDISSAMKPPVGKLSPAKATLRINTWAQTGLLRLNFSQHAKERQFLREFVISDIVYLLKYGFVLDEPSMSEKSYGYYKYVIQGKVLSNLDRVAQGVVIPLAPARLLVVTVMWKDKK